MVRKTRLENGIRVLSQYCPNTHVVSLGIWIDSGSRDESPSKEGITHFLEHMFFKGTEKRSTRDIAVELDILGGISNAFTTKENLCFYGKVLDKNLPRLMDIFCDILLNAIMDERELEKERFVILQEISMVEDSPEDYVHTVACEKFWKGHPLGHPICGYRETVKAFTREDILAFKDQIIHPEQVLIAAAGNVSHDYLVELAGRGLGSLTANGRGRPRRTSPEPAVFRDYIRKELEQTHICLLMPGVSLHDEERFSVYLLNIILGNSMSSRLFQEVREKRGLAYNIYSFLHCCEDTGVFGVYAAVAPEKLEECFKVIWNEMGELVSAGVSESEIAGAKDCAVGGMYLNLDATDALMNRIARNEFLYGREVTPGEIEEKIYAVSAESLSRWFAKVFPGKVSILVVGPSEASQVDIVLNM